VPIYVMSAAHVVFGADAVKDRSNTLSATGNAWQESVVVWVRRGRCARMPASRDVLPASWSTAPLVPQVRHECVDSRRSCGFAYRLPEYVPPTGHWRGFAGFVAGFATHSSRSERPQGRGKALLPHTGSHDP
jgi:hypothetical protein